MANKPTSHANLMVTEVHQALRSGTFAGAAAKRPGGAHAREIFVEDR
jgi:hypothetical protein